MFIHEYVTTNKKTQTKYITHRLVESVKTEKGPRQRIRMHLGTLTLPKTEWRKLASFLEARLAGQVSLFEDLDPDVAKIADQAMEHYLFTQTRQQEKLERKSQEDMYSVDLNSATTGDSRSLGPELVANSMWERLEFDTFLKSCGLDESEISLSKAVIIGRLVAPSSDLGTWKWFCNRTALAEMTPVDVTARGKDAFYEIADVLYAHKSQIEQGLRSNEISLFSLNTTLFLYDLTNTYFEGSCQNNELAARGKSKEKRTDCPLVTLALVVDQYGFPVFSQIYSGNQSEPQTLEEILNQVYTDGGLVFHDILPTIVMDRGIATKENIELIKSKKYPYTIIERRSVEKDYEEDFRNARSTFERIDKNEGIKPLIPLATKQSGNKEVVYYV
ncbi:IS1634 family transposase [Desulfofarcimen acetoxidans]|uniref:IS1634 family transposase n=1 Tax=Desulfofarcimen acetoxidans TaxID=58138 RepID=UPI00031C4CA2|nr:IS1634 family transposase [Desulfofarcimen acetoxidans]